MEINISKKVQPIYAIHKETGEKKYVNLLCIEEKRFNCPGDKWGAWHNYSKRGDWDIYIDI